MEIDQESSNDDIDIHDQYFGDDDDRDPDFIPEWEQRKKRTKSRKYEASDEEVESSSEDEKGEPISILLEHKTKSNTSNDLSTSEISKRKRKSESSSSDFDYPDDYMDIQTKKQKLTQKSPKKKKNNKSKCADKPTSQSKDKRKVKKTQTTKKQQIKENDDQESKQYRKYQTLEYKNHLHILSNLDPLLFNKYDNYDIKARNLEYFSSIMESNEHKYILHILPIIFNRSLIYHMRLLTRMTNERTVKIHFGNFCFGIRKYLETLINVRGKEREYLSKTADDVFRHLVKHKEKQYCLLLACEYFVKR